MRESSAPGMTRYRGRVSKRPDDVADLSFEQARDELVQIVATLEAGASTLDESMALWERGEALAARCQELLDGAQAAIDAVADGPEREDGDD